MTMPFGEKAAVIGGRKPAQQVTVLATGAPAAFPTPGGDYLTRLLADALYAPVAHSHPWSQITSKPTTLGGYGITDAQPASAELTAIAGLSSPGYVKRTGPGAYSVVASIPQADVAGGPFLPLAAGPSSPLTGTLHGTSLNFTGWTSDAPISVSMNYSNAYAHAITVANPSLTAGQRLTVDFGQAASTNNQANFGFSYAGPGSTANKITLGLYGNNDLVAIAGTGVVTVRDLGTGFVRASSGALSASALVAADIPNLDASKITTGAFADARIASATTWNAKLGTVTADATSRAANTFYAAPNGTAGVATFRAIVAADVPTLNQNTTGSAAKWTTPRTLTIGATGKALDGSANVSWSLAEIGAAPAVVGGYLPINGQIGGTVDFNNINSGARTLMSVFASSGVSNAPPGWSSGGGQGALWQDYGANFIDWATQLVVNAQPSGGALQFRTRQPAGNWMLWNTVWHSGNLSASTLPGGPYLPLAGGTMTGSIYSAARPGDGGRWLHFPGGSTGGVSTGTSTALIQRYQYAGFSGFVRDNTEFLGLTADHQYSGPGAQLSIVAGHPIGRISFFAGTPTLQASGSYQAPRVGDWTNSGLAITGTLSATSTFTAPGAFIGGHVIGTWDASVSAIWGDGVASRNISNYGFALARNGGSAAINGTSGSSLNVGGVWVVNATAAGAAVNGTLSATKITAGNAQMSAWSASPSSYARFGHHDWNVGGGFGYLQASDGEVYLEAPTGRLIHLRINGPDVAMVSSTGVTLSKALYLNDNVGAYIIGGRNGTNDPYFYVTSTGTPTAGIRLLTNNAGTGIVALSAAANGAITLASSLVWGGGGAIPSSDYVVQGATGAASNGVTGAASMADWRRSGFYAFATPTDGPSGSNWTHLIHNQGYAWPGGGQYTFQIASSFSGGSNLSWGPETYAMRVITGGTTQPWRTLWHSGNLNIRDLVTAPTITAIYGSNIASPGYTNYSFSMSKDGAIAYVNGSSYSGLLVGATAIALANSAGLSITGDLSATGTITATNASFGGATATSFLRCGSDSTQVPMHRYTTSSTLPVMGLNTWRFITCDDAALHTLYWSTNGTQSVRWTSGASQQNTPANSGSFGPPCNYRTWILYGPTVAGSNTCTLIVA